MLGWFPLFLLEARCSNKRDSAFYFYVKSLQASTPRGSDTDSDSKHYGAYYGKTRQASTPRGSDADLDYASTMAYYGKTRQA